MTDSQFEQAGAEHQSVNKQSLATSHANQLDAILPASNELVLTDLSGDKHTFTLQTFPTYKTAQVLQMLAKVKDDIDIVSLIGEIQVLSQPLRAENEEEATQGQAQKVVAALNAIPKLIEVAPDLLLEFAALAIIPNKELRTAYEGGTLEALRKERRTLIEFDFDASVSLQIFSAYLPFLGVNFLQKALSTLNVSVTKTLTSL